MKEQQLWAAVLWRAFQDAVEHGDTTYQREHVKNSISWLESKDALQVCALAGIEHESTVAAAHRARGEFVQWAKKRKRDRKPVNSRYFWQEHFGADEIFEAEGIAAE